MIQRIFAVSLLAVALLSAACTQQPTQSEIDDALFAEEMINTTSDEIVIFYPSTDTIVEERITLDSDVDAPLQAVQVLFEADPETPKLGVTLPKSEVRGLTVKDKVATVDFSAEVLDFNATENVQRVALASVLYTLQQFEGIEQVAFTVEGKTQGQAGGKDIARFWGDVTLADMPWQLTITSSTEGIEQ